MREGEETPSVCFAATSPGSPGEAIERLGIDLICCVFICMWELSQIDFTAQGERWGVP